MRARVAWLHGMPSLPLPTLRVALLVAESPTKRAVGTSARTACGRWVALVGRLPWPGQICGTTGAKPRPVGVRNRCHIVARINAKRRALRLLHRRRPECRPRRLPGVGTRNFFDAILQLNRRQNAMFHQQLIALGVGGQQAFGQHALHDVVHHRPGVAWHTRRRPLLDDRQHDDFRPQQVMILKLGPPFQHAHADFEVIDLRAQFVQGTSNQTRGHDLVVNHISADQLKTVFVEVFVFGRHRWHQRQLPSLHRAVKPGAPGLLVDGPGVASALRLAQAGALIHQRSQVGLHCRANVRHGAPGFGDETLSGLGRQLGSGGGGLRGHELGLYQTVAPALGSFGSSSFFTPPLIRSSRLMPSHMAMAAATKTEE